MFYNVFVALCRCFVHGERITYEIVDKCYFLESRKGPRRHASEELKGDREVVIAAVRRNGGALWSASEELKRDSEVVVEAARQNGDALQFASEEQRRDRDVLLEAVRQNT